MNRSVHGKSLLSSLLVGAALLCAAGDATAGQQLTREEHLLSRATYGARPVDVARVKQLGVTKWIDEQLHPERIDDAHVAAKVDKIESLKLSISELAKLYGPKSERRPQQLLNDLVHAKLIRAVESERQLQEVMSDFWFNHFNVFFGDGPVRYMVADYERNAIRPHVFGKFRDMLGATAKHPAMLMYLDNAMSNARRGVNENYARELLELHTLGVDGGYTEKDIQEIARAFTGWTVARPLEGMRNPMNPQRAGTFLFARGQHDADAKVILGRQFAPGRGIEDGEEVLDMVAKHPSTAKFIARKLVQRFVSDEPPADLVDEIARVFAKSDGDLREVTRALFTSSQFYDAKHQRTKVKSPFELVASALRITNAEFRMTPQLAQTLRSLGELPYTESAPTGFPITSEEWVNSGAMLNRINFGIGLAGGKMNGIRINWDASQGDAALVLGSPEFQRR